jgi:hypothetical protein
MINEFNQAKLSKNYLLFFEEKEQAKISVHHKFVEDRLLNLHL